MNARRIRLALISLFVILATGYFFYQWFLRPIDVQVYRITQGTVVQEALGTGSIESRRTIDVSFEVTGRIVRLEVDQSDLVKKGQILATIENRTHKAEVALMQQEVLLSESTLSRLNADIERAQAILNGATASLNRVQPLVERDAVSQEVLEAAEERRNVASAELSRAQAAKLEGQHAISASQRRLDQAKSRLAQTVVRSPFDGVVIRRDREVGDVLVPGAAVLRIAATDVIWASVWVDELYLNALSVGMPARIALRSVVEQHFTGKVLRIGGEVDRETRELLVDVSFDRAPSRLAFGQRVDLWIEFAKKIQATRIPAAAILRINGKDGVLIERDGRALFQPLKLGLRGREFIEVIDGLAEKSLVLEHAYGNNKFLKTGQRVRLPSEHEEEQAR